MLGASVECANGNHASVQRALFAADDRLKADNDLRRDVDGVTAKMRRSAVRGNTGNADVDAVCRRILNAFRCGDFAGFQFCCYMEGKRIIGLGETGV